MNKPFLHPFEQRMHKFLLEESLLSGGETVCCALSGGADSTALLLSLLALRKMYALHVTAVHINHHLRGAESDRDEQFCRELCAGLDVSLHVHHCDVDAYQRRHHVSVETAARECRYVCFAKENGVIATAHTASDHLETIVHRLMRGTGLHGLCGIPVKRAGFIRPLLFARRDEVEEYLHDRGQSYVNDSTNDADDYTRNRIRHKIVPLLMEMNPSAEQAVLRMSRSLSVDDMYLMQQAEAAFSMHFQPPNALHDVSALPAALRVRCMMLLLRRLGIACDAGILHRMEQTLSGGSCQLSGAWECHTSKGVLLVQKRAKSEAEMRSCHAVLGENCIFEGAVVELSLIEEQNAINIAIVNRKITNNSLDYDKIKGNVTLRSRKPGDRMQLAGRDFTVSIKKRIQEDVPLPLRSTLHFLEDENGTIFAEGIGIADRVKPVQNQTKRLLTVQVRRTVEPSSNEEKE